MIHLEGLGWLGAALAYRLEHAGMEFTWHDNDSAYTAWKASTGLVYPAGDARTMRNLRLWTAWAADGFLPLGFVARVRFAHTFQAPPHGGIYGSVRLPGGLTVADAPAFSVNVPGIVTAARERFADRRTDGPEPDDRLIVAHGSARATSFVWGWSADVAIAWPDGLWPYPEQAALYGQAHRFQSVHAYPVPGGPLRYRAGSSQVVQDRATGRYDNAAKAFDRWLEAFPKVYPDLAAAPLGHPVQGWRPRADPGDRTALLIRPDGALTLPALNHSGVRWAPELVEAAVQWTRMPSTSSVAPGPGSPAWSGR